MMLRSSRLLAKATSAWISVASLSAAHLPPSAFATGSVTRLAREHHRGMEHLFPSSLGSRAASSAAATAAAAAGMSGHQGDAADTDMLSHVKDERVRAALQNDLRRVVCKTCGMQYSVEEPRQLDPPDKCPVCEDERQYVPADGQQWTSIQRWLGDSLAGKVTTRLAPEKGEPRVLRVIVDGVSVGIGQTPMLVVTTHGIAIWDCCAAFTPSVAEQIRNVQREHSSKGELLPLLGIAISHPHFYTTALTWAQALDTKIIVSAFDEQWFMRRGETDLMQRHVISFKEQTYKLAPGLTMIRCGGHFDGSSVLHWDREKAPGPSSITADNEAGALPVTGAVFCADTFAPNMDRKTITFLWSYPNLVPLPPRDVLGIWHAMRPFAFDDIIGGWPGRSMHGEARTRMLWSAKRFVRMEGHDPDSFDWGD